MSEFMECTYADWIEKTEGLDIIGYEFRPDRTIIVEYVPKGPRRKKVPGTPPETRPPRSSGGLDGHALATLYTHDMDDPGPP